MFPRRDVGEGVDFTHKSKKIVLFHLVCLLYCLDPSPKTLGRVGVFLLELFPHVVILIYVMT